MTRVRNFFPAVAAAVLLFGASAAADVAAACKDCGTVVEVKTLKKQGEGSGVGAVIGGVAGGVLGHQVGGGRGKDVATVAGAAGGAYAGHQIEKSQKSTTSYQVNVSMDNGGTRAFVFGTPTSYRVGDKVKIVNKKLVRQ
jgi:outer membrane lipoprotein SlyB